MPRARRIMEFQVLATDYDGTIATRGVVDPRTIASLRRLRDAGKQIVLVTGRELDELLGIFPEVNLCSMVVAENGALLYRPADRSETLLGARPSPEFVDALRLRGVEPLSVGRCIVATFEPHDGAVFETIKSMHLELQVIFNKGAVMVLPTGINKATGLKAALQKLGIDPECVVGAGDAENDHAFLDICGCSVAVANALDSLKRHADIVTLQTHGAGVGEVIDRWLSNGLREIAPVVRR
jgi:hydroxymethylpyrimidine pyrophosphatase-like HAD family hydrolase